MGYNVDYPKAEFHEILPNLFQGGHLWSHEGRERGARHSSLSTDESWDYVVSTYFDDGFGSEACLPLCDMRWVLFKDTEKGLEEETWKKIYSVVNEVVERWQKGQKILIRCQAGYNRSGLLMCLALMRLGFSADKAIWQVRWRRGRHVLVNPVFERYVHEHEEQYCDLSKITETEALMNAFVPVQSTLEET